MKEMCPLDLTGRSSQRNCQRRTVLSLDGKLFGQWPRPHQGRGPRVPTWTPAGLKVTAAGAGCCGSLARAGGAAGSGPRGSSSRLALVVLLYLSGRMGTSGTVMAATTMAAAMAPEASHTVFSPGVHGPWE